MDNRFACFNEVAVGNHKTVEMCSISIQVEFDWLKVIIL